MTARRDGSTTVAATMRCAHAAGIDVFATGGIGGVHRGARNSFDVSADLHELARSQLALRIGDLAANRHQPARRIDLGVDAANGAGEWQVSSVCAKPDRLTDFEERKLLLGNGEVDAHRVEILQRHHRVAGRQILADVDPRNARGAGKRRRQLLLLEHSLQLVYLRSRSIRRRARGIERGVRSHAAPLQFERAGQRRLVGSGLRLLRHQIGFFDGIIKL